MPTENDPGRDGPPFVAPVCAVRRARLAYAALYASKFTHLGVQLPFFSGWLRLQGLDAAAIGWIAGGALGARLALGPLIALWADRRADSRDGLRAVSLLFAASAALLLVAPGAPGVAAAAALVLWSFGVLLPLADAGALAEARTGGLDFGRTRAIGSGAFLLATLASGEILTQAGVAATPAIMAAAAVATFLAVLALPRRDAATGATVQAISQARGLFASPPFMLLLAASALIQGSHAVYYAFSILHWTELGYSPRVIGALWATGVVAEIALLTRMKSVASRLTPASLLALGAAGGVVRWTATALEPPLAPLFLVQTLHALTFAAAYMGALGYIDRAAPGRMAATALTLNSTLGVGAATGIAMVVAGEIYADHGGGAAYLLMAAMSACGLAAAAALARLAGQERRADNGLR
jgi:PPP family 3-phenylpropionic acid transporter